MLNHDYGGHATGGSGAGGAALLMLMIVLMVGVPVLVFYVVRDKGVTQASAATHERHTHEQRLGDRLARDEIDPDDYRARLTAPKEGSARTT